MKKTGFLYDSRYLLHDTGEGHPEKPERLTAIYQGIETADLLPKLKMIEARPSNIKWIESVHDSHYIEKFRKAAEGGQRMLGSMDNAMCGKTFDVALLAVGGILASADLIMDGTLDNAFCAVRPPGHHAERDKAMGFCYFNNVAIAARYLQQKWGLDRIAIMDLDVHHGNGTQHIFEEDPSVLYYSIHEHPSFCFPGTGREFEKGIGMGVGYTRNTPVLPGMGDEEYKRYLNRDIPQLFDIFDPQFLIISLGYDAHEDDDMANIKLTTEGYSWVIKKIKQTAQTYCNGKLLIVLEGGYCIPRLPELARNTMQILLED